MSILTGKHCAVSKTLGGDFHLGRLETNYNRQLRYLAPTLVALCENVHHLVFANQQHDQKVQQPNGGDQGGHHAEPQPQQDRHCVVRDV